MPTNVDITPFFASQNVGKRWEVFGKLAELRCFFWEGFRVILGSFLKMLQICILLAQM